MNPELAKQKTPRKSSPTLLLLVPLASERATLPFPQEVVEARLQRWGAAQRAANNSDRCCLCLIFAAHWTGAVLGQCHRRISSARPSAYCSFVIPSEGSSFVTPCEGRRRSCKISCVGMNHLRSVWAITSTRQG